MAWRVVVDGTPLRESFDTEDEASQAAADRRGNDWSKKIDVVELKPEAKPEVPPKK